MRSGSFLRDIALGIFCSLEPNDHQHLFLQFSTAQLILPSPIGHPQQFYKGEGQRCEEQRWASLLCSLDFPFQQAGDIIYHVKPNG